LELKRYQLRTYSKSEMIRAKLQCALGLRWSGAGEWSPAGTDAAFP
jgi:hypothetical protein